LNNDSGIQSQIKEEVSEHKSSGEWQSMFDARFEEEEEVCNKAQWYIWLILAFAAAVL